jgi:histidinol-phosphate aminotransferase
MPALRKLEGTPPMPIKPKRAVQSLPPYPKPEEGRHAYVRLDFNENTTGYPQAYPPGMPHQSVSAYPEYGQLVDRLAKFYSVAPDQLLLTNGSDEGLFITAHTFIEPNESSAVVSTPCFVVIPHCLTLAGAKVTEVKVREDLSFDIEEISAVLKKGVQVAMFATPENPTGAVLDGETIQRWCRQYPDTLFAIDEAYGEFAGSSMVPYINKFENLLVLKTFSKAWGMAGLRLGIVFGNAQLLSCMQVVKMPYTVNTAAVWTANKLLDESATVQASVKCIMQEKARMVAELKGRSFKMDEGSANSVLLHAGVNAQPLTDACRAQGVLVRNRSSVRFPADLNGNRPVTWGRVRASVGTKEETDRLLKAIDRFCNSYAVIFDLDGTLVDVTASYDRTVHQLFEQHAGTALPAQELRLLRAEGGYNDDWVAVKELLKRRGIDVPLATIAEQGLALYMTLAKGNEPMLIELETLRKLGKRYPLFIVTGRSRKEYDPIWADALNHLFKQVLCLYDLPGKQGKPAPDYLHHLMEQHGFKAGVYIGNAVDDMQAGRAAGLDAIGITTTHPADVLRQAGAQLTITSPEALAEVFML